MSRNVSDVLRIMRLAIGRRNANDPDSNDATLLQYVNDFISLSMSDEFHIHEKFHTFEFTLTTANTDGVWPVSTVFSNDDMVNLTSEVMISLASPSGSSVSWRHLQMFHDPGTFYDYWGINNQDILITGAPTEVLFHGTDLVFRTIPDQSYLINFYGYQSVGEFSSTATNLPQAYWFRFAAYGAAKQYAADYRLDQEATANIERNFRRERRLLLTRTHNHIKTQRALPRF